MGANQRSLCPIPELSATSDRPEHAPPLRIGRSLARLRQELVNSSELLREVLDPAGADLVTNALGVLQRQVCRIAVIGQIKAGKSSFVNALIQQPDLLPTDVNPWTTAVTRLHFQPEFEHPCSAIFHFFTEPEWEQLADGGGKLRELTERLVPGFEPELLRQHLTQLKARAVSRLGAEYGKLLGGRHRFETLSRDILLRYVCQGDPGAPSAAGHLAGRYSDITRSADIYLREGPFDYPSVVIDTPGTNDPFLVRDEITRRALEAADLYIVVLNASQALAASDVALLRILRGLHKDRIVVFLNRIDQLPDIARDSELVATRVRQRLHTEFPGSDIPIIAGSARWANCVFADGNLDAAVVGRASSYLRRAGLVQHESLVRLADGGTRADTDVRATLFAASGLKQVYQAIDDFLATSRDAYMLRQMTASFSEMVHATRNAARLELQSLTPDATPDSAAHERAQQELSRLREELQQLRHVSSIIANSTVQFKEQQEKLVADEIESLRRRLLSTVRLYAARECDEVANELMVGRALQKWTVDLEPIRRQLADDFINGFHAAEARLLDLQQEVLPHLRGLLSLLVQNAGSALQANTMYRQVPPPTMMSLGSPISLDLASWWSLLWRSRSAPAQQGRKVAHLINSEFGQVVDELMAACEKSLIDQVNVTSEWTFGIGESIARSIARRREELVRHYECLRHTIDGAADAETLLQQRQYIATLNKRVESCESLSETLTSIQNNIARDLPSAED